MFQRKPQSVLFKALSRTFRKSPKEFCFPKIVHTSQCPVNTSPVASKFQYVGRSSVPKEDTQRPSQWAVTNYSKIAHRYFVSQNLSTQNTALTNTSPVVTKFQYVLIFYIPKKYPQHPAQGPQRSIRKLAKEILFPKSCPHRTLPTQILHQQLPNSSMLFFSMFQFNMHSALLK